MWQSGDGKARVKLGEKDGICEGNRGEELAGCDWPGRSELAEGLALKVFILSLTLLSMLGLDSTKVI